MKLSDLRLLRDSLSTLSAESSRQQLNEHLTAMGLDPENLYQELEMTSRFVDTHRDISPANAPVQLHSHAFYEILYCCSTGDVEYLVGTDRYRLQKGDVIIIPPGISHRPLLSEEMAEPYKRYVLWLSMEFAQMLRQMLQVDLPTEPDQSVLIRTTTTQRDILHSLFRAGIRESENRRLNWEAVVMGNTIQLAVQLHRCLAEQTVPQPETEKPELLDRVLWYIEHHLSEKIILSDVAKQFFVSESTITQTFRKRMGESFYHCVTQRRLIAAKALIQGGEQLETVGHQVGFADYSTFYRAFKKEYGISPNQFRRMVGTEEL